jgi:glycosyltransferase involved in cell wall biosynthesis
MPRITVVTPSYNQGKYLEQTVLSVLNQGYPDLEYIVMDGGSKDNSVEILRKYAGQIDHWVSERDEGQADAVLKGFRRATGEILCWVNSDDILLPGALRAVGEHFASNPDTELLVGGCVQIDENGEFWRDRKKRLAFNLGTDVTYHQLLFIGCRFAQPASFWKRSVFFEVGGFDPNLRFCFDYDMYLRMTRRKPGVRLPRFLAAFRVHPESKSSTLQEIRSRENGILYQRFGRDRIPAWRRAWHRFYCRRLDRMETRRLRRLHRLGVLQLPTSGDRDPATWMPPTGNGSSSGATDL